MVMWEIFIYYSEELLSYFSFYAIAKGWIEPGYFSLSTFPAFVRVRIVLEFFVVTTILQGFFVPPDCVIYIYIYIYIYI